MQNLKAKLNMIFPVQVQLSVYGFSKMKTGNKLTTTTHIDISQKLICEQNGCVDLRLIDVKMECPTSDATLNMKLVNTSSEKM